MKRVLFVCVHNSGRSQMAAAFLEHLGQGTVAAASAGTSPSDRVSPAAVEAMRKKGIDSSLNRPRLRLRLPINRMGLPAFLGLVLVAVLVIACGGGSSPATAPPEARVRPLTDILVGELVFSDVGPHSATVLVDTSIPVVCAAAYGATTAYGQLATDTDMVGSGHQNHHPLLTGLEADTEYHVQVQGVAADGTLYQSGDYTFRTAPETDAGAQPSDEENLALLSTGARVTGVSSNYGGGDADSTYGANHAIDGNPSTEWSSHGDGDQAWLEIELAVDTHVTAIGFWTRTMSSSAQIFSFQVVTDRSGVYGPFELSDASQTYFFDTDFVASRLRFEATETNGGNTGAVEIEVHGEPVE